MEAKELRGFSAGDLTQKLASLREEVSQLALKRASGRLENPMKLKETKRDLARVETVLREKELQGQKA
jgi:large subunit ribosomal protein L29